MCVKNPMGEASSNHTSSFEVFFIFKNMYMFFWWGQVWVQIWDFWKVFQIDIWQRFWLPRLYVQLCIKVSMYRQFGCILSDKNNRNNKTLIICTSACLCFGCCVSVAVFFWSLCFVAVFQVLHFGYCVLVTSQITGSFTKLHHTQT